MMKKASILWFSMAAGVAAFSMLAGTGSEIAQAVESEDSLAPAAIVTDTFVAIDVVGARPDNINRWGGIHIRGVLEGTSEVIERTYFRRDSVDDAPVERCDRLALLALTKPGAYKLELIYSDTSIPHFLFACALQRND